MELMIVIVIIGILSAVGMVMFGGQAEKAKIAATLSHHTQAAKYTQYILSLCETGGTHGYTNQYGSWVDYTCDYANGLTSPLIQYFNTMSDFKNPYNNKLVGVRSSTIYSNRDRKNGGQDLERKYSPSGSGYICCHTLGLVAIEPGSSSQTSCNGNMCCFHITTAYDLDTNDNAIVKIDTVSGNTCTR